jgi:hypothetical protein
MNKLSTVRTEDNGPFRAARCDDDGYQEIKVIGGVSSAPLPTTYPAVTPIVRSGTITTGGVPQVLMAANPNRKGFDIQNTSGGILYINETNGSASIASKQIPIGALYESPLGGTTSYAISIFGVATGQTFVSMEW